MIGDFGLETCSTSISSRRWEILPSSTVKLMAFSFFSASSSYLVLNSIALLIIFNFVDHPWAFLFLMNVGAFNWTDFQRLWSSV
ncbi:hypothetical protein IC582_001153 [Cucumis melo]